MNNFDIICVEDLDVKDLKEKGHNNGMHRSIHDASWSEFIFMLSYKAQSAGRKLIKVHPEEHYSEMFFMWKHNKERTIWYECMSALIVVSHVIEITMLL